jgi:hypothetical protein
VRIGVSWHPARGVDLEVVRWELKTPVPHVVVRLPDGSGVRIPFRWTEAGGAVASRGRCGRFTIDSLCEITTLVESLLDRCGAGMEARAPIHAEASRHEATDHVGR